MPGSIRRRTRRVRNAGVTAQRLRHAHPAAKRGRYDSIRVVGAPLAVTLPRIRGIRPSYCSKNDEQPAVQMALSMFRLGIARAADWSGSAVDCVAKALSRFCRSHGIATLSRVFPESTIRIHKKPDAAKPDEKKNTVAKEERCRQVFMDSATAELMSLPGNSGTWAVTP